jgi:hypothetical protein
MAFCSQHLWLEDLLHLRYARVRFLVIKLSEYSPFHFNSWKSGYILSWFLFWEWEKDLLLVQNILTESNKLHPHAWHCPSSWCWFYYIEPQPRLFFVLVRCWFSFTQTKAAPTVSRVRALRLSIWINHLSPATYFFSWLRAHAPTIGWHVNRYWIDKRHDDMWHIYAIFLWPPQFQRPRT